MIEFGRSAATIAVVDSRRILAEEDGLASIGSPCSYDEGCITGVCELFNTTMGLCKDIYKSCRSNCSGAGACIYVERSTNSPMSMEEVCSISSERCEAVCVCHAGAYGTDCSLTRTEYKNLIVLREYVCSSVFESIGLQEHSYEVLIGRVVLIGNALKDAGIYTLYILIYPL